MRDELHGEGPEWRPVWWRSKVRVLTTIGGEVREIAWEGSQCHWGEALTAAGAH